MSLDNKTVISVTWDTTCSSYQHQLVALIDQIEVIMVACYHDFSCDKISPYFMLHIHIGRSSQESFFGVITEGTGTILVHLYDEIL